MKTLLQIRNESGLSLEEMAEFLKISVEALSQLEKENGQVTGRPLARLKQMKAWLKEKPDPITDMPDSCALFCIEQLNNAKFKQMGLELQLERMQERFAMLNKAHTLLQKSCAENSDQEDLLARLNYRKFMHEMQLGSCGGQRQAVLKMKLLLISAEIGVLTRCLEENGIDPMDANYYSQLKKTQQWNTH